MPYAKCSCGTNVFLFGNGETPECTPCYEKRMGYDKMRRMSFKRFHDPGHSWAEIPVSLLREFGIAGAISRYSYRRGGNAYLEEDCDLGLFVAACHARNIHPAWDEEITNDSSPIRSYRHYTA